MSRIKCLAALLLIALTVSASAETYTITPTAFTETFQAKASLYPPEERPVVLEDGPAILTEICVSTNDKVAEGDTLARLQINADTEAIEQAELQLKILNRNYRDTCANYDARIAEQEAAFAAIEDRDARELASLELELLRNEYEMYRYNANNEIEDAMDDLAELREDSEELIITAPIDGIVSQVTAEEAGTWLDNGTVLMKVRKDERSLLYVEDSDHVLACGMTVQVSESKGLFSALKAVTGRVIVANNVLPVDQELPYALIRTDEPLPEGTNAYNVSCELLRVEDAIVIPTEALNENNGSYVTVVEADGSLREQRVTKALTTNQKVWILQGLESGMTLQLYR